ncbi:hypothetical protein HDU92_009161 [Lobulomyces angularis]|nr:hypothetical protein HDU92_009161 [Lobulomyces angularis]
MASMRDAMRRLNIIYEACAPEAIAEKAAEKGLDEFTRTKKKINQDVKQVRQALKEREVLIQRHGTSSETAEASYHVRILLRSINEDITRLKALYEKDEKKKGKKRLPEDELKARKEIVELCGQHLAECDDMEKRRFLEKNGVDRSELLQGGTGVSTAVQVRRPYGTDFSQEKMEVNDTRKALFEGTTDKGRKKKADQELVTDDPFVSKLPEIDVEEDFKLMNEKNKLIDKDLEDIGFGVQKLKEIAQGMNQELDAQNDALRDLEKDVDKALDGVDNINIRLKQVVDKMMTGDRFMINCILLCVILGLVAFIASIFT